MKTVRKVIVLAVVMIALVGVAAAADGMAPIDPSIIGEWRWTEASTPVGSLEPLPRQEYLVTFREDGTVLLDFESNEIDGVFTADGSTVSITPDTSGSPDWLPGSPAERLLELISQARDYSVTESELSLETLGGNGSLDFERVN